jgi:hypothetical protein
MQSRRPPKPKRKGSQMQLRLLLRKLNGRPRLQLRLRLQKLNGRPQKPSDWQRRRRPLPQLRLRLLHRLVTHFSLQWDPKADSGCSASW